MLDLDEVDQHPHNSSRKSFIRKENIVIPVPAPQLSATPGVSSKNKQLAVCGHHSSEILKSIGYSQTEINKFLDDKIVFEELKSKL